MPRVGPDAGSFRDPGGQIYFVDDRVLRTVMPVAAADYEFVRSTGVIQKLIERQQLIAETVVDRAIIGEPATDAKYVLEHPRLPLVSYPYEWPFSALKAAALLHLDIQVFALEYDVALSDASAYNIQFLGPKPIFIDSLSFRHYQDGEFWLGHKQFCEQFLNPLLLRALCGIPHNAWYRGTLEGISAQELSQLISMRQKFSLNIMTHVVMQSRLQGKPGGQQSAEETIKSRKLPKNAYRHLLSSLRKWISKLEPKDTGKTVWADYAKDNSYSSKEARVKLEFISEFTASVEPSMMWDIGCNTGEYSKVALSAGADYVVGFDFDQNALDLGFSRASTEKLNFLPLFLDAANPPPAQGWRQQERAGLMERANADALLALALVHHLAISRNIPLPDVIDWLVNLAPAGVIEFVPKSDPMVSRLLGLREDIFSTYNRETFVRSLQGKSKIDRSLIVSDTGRELFWYQRT